MYRRFGCGRFGFVAVLTCTPSHAESTDIDISAHGSSVRCVCGIWLFKESSNSLFGGQTNGGVVVAFGVGDVDLSVIPLTIFGGLFGNLILSTLNPYTPFLRRSKFARCVIDQIPSVIESLN